MQKSGAKRQSVIPTFKTGFFHIFGHIVTDLSGIYKPTSKDYRGLAGAIDIKNVFAYNNSRRKACFSNGLTLKSDMLVNHVIDRWRTTLKSDTLTSLRLVVGRQH